MPSPEASRRNLEKARARWRPPRPWRSLQETNIIIRLVWQWFNYGGPGKWSGRAVARWLGVSHTYVQKLVRQFVRDPNKMQREERTFGLATWERLGRAQEETRLQKERGWLRPARRWKWAEFKIGEQVVRAVVPTKASTRVPRVPQGVPVWAGGIPSYSADNPCDPLIAIKRAREESQRPLLRYGRRWRPGKPFRP